MAEALLILTETALFLSDAAPDVLVETPNELGEIFRS
jgi:hypothetical protein